MRFSVFSILALCLFLHAGEAAAKPQDFGAWLDGVRKEARAKGVSEKTIAEALPPTLAPIETVIKLDRKQPEKTRSFEDYRDSIVSHRRIQDGRSRYQDNRRFLYEIGSVYGVDPQYIVSLWGIETNFGRNTGGYNVVAALATLAWEGRRGDYFKQELIKALQIIDKGHISADKMKGSWAGAMGQTQFMPTSFFKFAQDYNKDGRSDIWNQPEDVFASAANYLAQSGWKHGEPWGRPVRLPRSFDSKLIGLDNKHPLQFWHDKGVRLPDGGGIPFEGAWQASLVQPGGPGTPAYIVYDNYRVIMKWNRSTYFATAVGLLADEIKG